MKSKSLEQSAKILGFTCVMFSLAMMAPNALAQLNSNVPIDDQVMLLGNAQGEGICFSGDLAFNSQLLPTGQVVPFSIPADRTLVITDVNWSWNDEQNRFPNVHQLLTIYLFGGAISGNPVALAGAQLDATSFGSANISMSSGFAAASGSTVCGNFRPGPATTPGVIIITVIRGYLISNVTKRDS